MRARPIFKYGLLGFAAGAVVSILFFPLNLLAALILLVPLLAMFFARPPGGRATLLTACGVAGATVAVALVLPVKQLDGQVGPFQYGRMSLDQLCQALGKDHSVYAIADRSTWTNVLDSFVIERRMSRREVLEKLAHDTDCELHIGYCANGATFLFGAYPSYTRLRAREPNGATNSNLRSAH
jgi:hypothetical protein